MSDIEVKGTLLRTDSEPDGTYTIYVRRHEGGIRCVQMLSVEMITAIYSAIGPSKEIEFSITTKEPETET